MQRHAADQGIGGLWQEEHVDRARQQETAGPPITVDGGLDGEEERRHALDLVEADRLGQAGLLGDRLACGCPRASAEIPIAPPGLAFHSEPFQRRMPRLSRTGLIGSFARDASGLGLGWRQAQLLPEVDHTAGHW